jgi:crossover junction endodeoxyribonuclease RuvC
MRILGIDPGSNATGYGVVDQSEGKLIHVAHGVLRPPKDIETADRLAFIHRGMTQLVSEFAPDASAIESIFVAANARSALVLGQARGVALAALGLTALPISEISAREVKKAVVGTGAATKSQVQAMVKRLLLLEKEPPTDAADALAIAICQAHAGRLASLGVRSGRRRRRPNLRGNLGVRKQT